MHRLVVAGLLQLVHENAEDKAKEADCAERTGQKDRTAVDRRGAKSEHSAGREAACYDSRTKKEKNYENRT